MQNDGNNSGETIGGYVVVEHRFCNGYHDHAVTHAFADLAAAEKHVEGRIEQITRRDGGYAADETWLLNHDDHPTLHAVSPRIFAKAQDHLSRGHDYEAFAYRLGTAIARHTEESEWSRVKYPYTYKVGETEVFGTKSEYADAIASASAGAAVASPAVDAALTLAQPSRPHKWVSVEKLQRDCAQTGHNQDVASGPPLKPG